MKNRTTLAWFICSLAAFFYCYEYLLRILPSVMVSQLMHYFNLSASGVGFLTAMYYHAYTPMQAVVGVVTDRHGPKRILTMAIGFCVIGNILFVATPSVTLAAIGRFLIGFGSSFAFVGVLKLADIWLPKKRFAFFVGLATSLGMLGAMIGDIGLAKLVLTIGWHTTIWGSAILGVLLIPLFIMYVSDRNDSACSTNNSPTPHLSTTYQEALQNLWQVLQNKQLWLAGFIGCMLYMSLSVIGELWGIPFLRAYHHVSLVKAATTNSMIFLGWLVGAPLAGWVSDYIHSRRIPLIVGSAASVVLLLLVFLMPHLPIWATGSVLFLFGLFASTEICCFAIARESVSSNISATALALVNFYIMLGGMALQPLVGCLLDYYWTSGVEQGIRVYSLHNYHQALAIVPVGLGLAVIASLFLKETYVLHPKVHRVDC